jgi:tripeptide aminopeptidase
VATVSSRLFETFVRLCEIRSPTGEEREIADTVAAELRALGLEVSEDDAAGPAEAGAGNLLARLPGQRDEWVMFCAHLDTVPHKGLVEVVNDEGVFRSRGETILGADNKAAVAVFMELVAHHAEALPPVGIELVLTVAEEQGLRGAKAFDTSILRSRTGFVLDHAGPVGEVIVATPTQQKILADFMGIEAHAGIQPEAGSSAIAAAAAAIGRMELGRLDEQTTANVGLIKGGTSGNVVPGHCWIQAEARSRDAGRAAEVAGQISDACAWGAGEHGCDVDVRLEELFRGYEVPSSSPALGLAEAGLRSAGLESVRAAIGGGSDANAFRLHGFDAVLLANGTDAVHTEDEHVPAVSLEKMLEVCEGIVAAVAAGYGDGPPAAAEPAAPSAADEA